MLISNQRFSSSRAIFSSSSTRGANSSVSIKAMTKLDFSPSPISNRRHNGFSRAASRSSGPLVILCTSLTPSRAFTRVVIASIFSIKFGSVILPAVETFSRSHKNQCHTQSSTSCQPIATTRPRTQRLFCHSRPLALMLYVKPTLHGICSRNHFQSSSDGHRHLEQQNVRRDYSPPDILSFILTHRHC